MMFQECWEQCQSFDYWGYYMGMPGQPDLSVSCDDWSSSCDGVMPDPVLDLKYVCSTMYSVNDYTWDLDGESAGNFCAP